MTGSRRVLGAGAAAVACAALTACGGPDTTINGRSALGQGADGSPVAYVDTCSGAVDEITLAGGRDGLKGSETNPSLGALQASSAQSGRLAVALQKLAAPWRITSTVRMPTTRDAPIIVIASQRSKNTEVTQAGASLTQLAALKPGQVISDTGIAITEQQFHARACSSP